jgi:putative aminopeptidase FrvX
MIDELQTILQDLVLAPGVSGNEGPVAAVITGYLGKAGIPDSEINRDRLGNLWVKLGGEGEARRLLVAHMDEIGLRVTSIRADGFCHVVPIGGIDPALWEGSPVTVHTDDGPVTGCIAPQSLHVTVRQGQGRRERVEVKDLVLDLGVSDAEAVDDLGVKLLDTVTWPKSCHVNKHGLVMARSIDDRFGCAALVALAAELKEAHLSEPVILAWSVQEEIGLRGARQMPFFGALREVIAVDSFTVGHGPFDNRRFDGPFIGGGPVFRCFDATTLVPDEMRKRVLAKAAGLGTKLQYGYMPGGNDASVFSRGETVPLPFGICVQYSHTQAERCLISDLKELTLFLAAWCDTDCE